MDSSFITTGDSYVLISATRCSSTVSGFYTLMPPNISEVLLRYHWYQFAVSVFGELINLMFVIYLASLAGSGLVLVCAMSGMRYRDEL